MPLERRTGAERDDGDTVGGANMHDARHLLRGERVANRIGGNGRVIRFASPMLLGLSEAEDSRSPRMEMRASSAGLGIGQSGLGGQANAGVAFNRTSPLAIPLMAKRYSALWRNVHVDI